MRQRLEARGNHQLALLTAQHLPLATYYLLQARGNHEVLPTYQLTNLPTLRTTYSLTDSLTNLRAYSLPY